MLPPGFSLKRGSTTDRPLLLKFLHRSYQEFYPETGFAHLQDTLNHYFTADTPLWWVQTATGALVGCLWLGTSIDQISGDRHSHIFLLYVLPDYRRQGLGSALMARAEQYAKTRGDRQITLQVFTTNQTAQGFYHNLAYNPHAILMRKTLP
ncbi:GNAT family N-acetyltransferase [Synechococcus moorigangaii CMS01]|nr:GNAT family N-acetyltransferase [Synechococcus moorigangaii CMS01]